MCDNKCGSVEVVQKPLTAEDVQLEIFRNRSEMEARIIIKETGEMIDRIPVQWKARENKLDYLSVSKTQAYEQCPACMYRQYLDDDTTEVDGSNYYTKVGSILHTVCELAVKYYRDNGIIVDPVSIFDQVWKEQDLTGFEPYVECKKLIVDYFKNNPVDKRQDDAVIIEAEWRGELGGCTFGLMIDYAGVFRNNPKAGILRDYKSNRMPFTPAELDSSLQLRIYELVIRRHLVPEVEQWITGYDLYRYGWQQCPPRTMDDLLDAEQYIANIWHQISHDNTWEERLNPYCGYRECRHTCKTYADFVKNPGRYVDSIKTDNVEIADIERQREALATYEKIAKTRKDELSNAVKAEIEQLAQQGQKLVVDGKELNLYSNATSSYKYYDTRNVLLAHNKLNILDNCLTVQKTKLDNVLKNEPSLKLALAGCLSTNYASPYITKSKVK